MNKTYFYRKSRLCLLALLCALFFFRISYADVTGELDGGCKYTIYDNGKLKFFEPNFGSCTLPSNDTLSTSFYPWQGNENITSVYVEAGVSTGTSAAYLLYNLSGATSFDLTNLNVEGTTNMSSMFQGCSSLTSLSISNWNTGSVTDMSSMFQGCSSLTSLTDSGLDRWNTEKVENMGFMFQGCSSLESTSPVAIEYWETKSVTYMRSMFQGCSSLNDLSGLSDWNTEKVKNMSYMFQGCSSLTSVNDISGWKTGSVTDMSSMFQGCSILATLSYADLLDWNTENVTNMSSMFQGCSLLKSSELDSIRSWVTNKVSDASSMFQGCSGLETLNNISGWNLGSDSDVNMNNMFKNCTSVKSANFSGWTFNADTTGTLDGVSDAVIKLNQYFSDMKGTNLYVVGKHGCSDLGLTTDPGNLIYEPSSVQVSFTGGTGTATLSGAIDNPNTYYYTKVCTAYPDEAICASGYAKGNFQSGSDCSISDITPDNGMKVVSVTATDAAGKSTALAAPDYKLKNIQSNYTVDVQLGYTLTYEPGAGVSGNVPAAKNYIVGAAVTVSDGSSLIKSGYVFSCWSENGTDCISGNTFNMPSNDVTLKAVFTAAPTAAPTAGPTTEPTATPTATPAVTYTLTYKKDADISGAVPAAAPYAEGAVVTMANGGSLKKDGYIFAGWSDGSTTYAAGFAFYMPSHDVTLKAVFHEIPAGSFILTYKKDEDVSGIVPAAEAHLEGTVVTLADAGNLSKGDLYGFVGWNDGTTTYSAGTSFTMPAHNVTLKAIFAKKHAIEFDSPAEFEGPSEGSLPEIEIVPTGNILTLPTDKNDDGSVRFSYGEYPFIGWRIRTGSPIPALRKTNSRSVHSLAAGNGNRIFRSLRSNQPADNGTLKTLAGTLSAGGMKQSLRLSTTKTVTEYWVNRNFIFVMPDYDVIFEPIISTEKYPMHFDCSGADTTTIPEEQYIYFGTTVTLAEVTKPGCSFVGWAGMVENEYGEKEYKLYAPGDVFVMPKHDVTLKAIFSEVLRQEPLPEDEIGTYSFDEYGNKFYIQFHSYDICMHYMGDEDLCRNTSANLYNR